MTAVRVTAVGLALLSMTACGSAVASEHAASTAADPRAVPTGTVPRTPTGSLIGSPDAEAPAPARALPSSTEPVRIRIPAIRVDSGLQRLTRQRDDSLQTPSRWQRAGWFAQGVRPGDVGPAVIAGHVDSTSGPAVFYRLGSLRVGDRIEVTRVDGHQVTFAVDSTAEYPKRAFPTAAVYGPTSVPVLRLVTCGGDFDRRAGSYVDNLVVTAFRVSG